DQRVDRDVDQQHHRQRHDEPALLGDDPAQQRPHRRAPADDWFVRLVTCPTTGLYVTSTLDCISPCSVTRSSSADPTFSNRPLATRLFMKRFTSSTLRATTLICRPNCPRSIFGRTAVMRASSGSVCSKMLKSSVQENVRRSIRSLAWRASLEARSICLLSTDPRIFAADAFSSFARDSS